MAGPQITVESREDGTDGVGHAIQELNPSHPNRLSKPPGSTNDPNGTDGASEKFSFLESKAEDAEQGRKSDVRSRGGLSNLGNRPSRDDRKGAGGFSEEVGKQISDDLNILLVIASLITAVISAFIVYVHPQLQPDSQGETAALLSVLLYKQYNFTVGGEVPRVQPWTGPPRTIVATQTLLYLALLAALSSVLFSVLAKQLLRLYTLAATWSPPTENGKSYPPTEDGQDEEQQLRLKGFTTGLGKIVLALSFLLQLALLFICCALTIFLWNINIVIASIVLAITVCFVPVYCLFGIFTGATIGLSRIREMSGRR